CCNYALPVPLRWMALMTAPIRQPLDWSAIADDVHCPLCDYNLRGLTDPRCPECGTHFDWPELLDPAKRKHPFLFEHHPERRFWSFWRTAVAGLRPRRFWSSLLPVQPSFPRRLLLYWGLTMLIVLFAPLGILGSAVIREVHQVEQQRTADRKFMLAR